MRFLKVICYSCSLIFAMLLVSCSDEVRELDPLDVEILKEQLPFTEFANATKVIFKDASNNERAFNVELQSITSAFGDSDISYKSDNEKIILTPDNESNPFPSNTSFTIDLSSSYIDEVPVKDIQIVQSTEVSALFSLKLDAAGMPSNGSVSSISIMNTFYEDVFTSSHATTNEVEAGFYFHKKYGIIGFMDELGNMLAFDRFE